MFRSLLMAASIAAVVSYTAPAWACDGEGDCHSKAKKKQSSPSKEVDDAMAARCSCTSAADCTCKKGECKCPKCGSHKRQQMLEPLKGASHRLPAPKNAQLDARAGTFI